MRSQLAAPGTLTRQGGTLPGKAAPADERSKDGVWWPAAEIGPLPAKAVECLQALPPDQLKALGCLLHANRLSDLGLE